jgi:tripartite-type tricarboxylate transporter receptor subunit TctC
VWWGVFAPALTPKEIVSRLAASFASAVREPEIKAKLVAPGFYRAPRNCLRRKR